MSETYIFKMTQVRREQKWRYIGSRQNYVTKNLKSTEKRFNLTNQFLENLHQDD